MLWSRSASLTSRTRMSPAIATIILRTFSAWASSPLRNSSLSSFVSPSTMRATSLPNSSLDVAEADGGVLDGVVQEGGGEGRGVEPEVGEDPRHGDGMLDVGLARETMLALVRVLGEAVGALEELRVGLRVVGTDLLQDRREAVRRSGLASSEAGPRDPGETPAALGRDGLRLFSTRSTGTSCSVLPTLASYSKCRGRRHGARERPRCAPTGRAAQYWMKVWTS